MLVVYRMLGGRTPTQRAVRPLRVVALPPVLNDAPGVGETAEPMDVQAFVTELAVGALEVTVLHGLCRG